MGEKKQNYCAVQKQGDENPVRYMYILLCFFKTISSLCFVYIVS